MWTPPFTSTGPICWHRVACRVPRPVWIGPQVHTDLLINALVCVAHGREWNLVDLHKSTFASIHTGRDAMRKHKWNLLLPMGCSHWMQATSRELPANLHARVQCGLGHRLHLQVIIKQSVHNLPLPFQVHVTLAEHPELRPSDGLLQEAVVRVLRAADCSRPVHAQLTVR